jgi:hypothetical protein
MRLPARLILAALLLGMPLLNAPPAGAAAPLLEVAAAGDPAPQAAMPRRARSTATQRPMTEARRARLARQREARAAARAAETPELRAARLTRQREARAARRARQPA